MPREKRQIRISDTRQFKSCRRLWFFTSHHRMNLERMRPVDYFFFGRGIHYALSALYEDGTPPAPVFSDWYTKELDLVRAQTGGLFEEEEQMFAELLELGTGMLDHYVQWAPEALDTGLLTLGTEVEFELPLLTPRGYRSGWYTFAGRFDRVARGPAGALWVIDFKTSARPAFANIERRLQNDEQATAYIYALQRLHPKERIGGAMFVYLKKALPTIPKLIYKGKALSQNKQMDTTLTEYVEAIKGHGFDYRDYTNFLRHLQEKGNTFFKCFEVKRHPKQLQRFEKDLYRTVQDISTVRTLDDAYPNPPWYGCQRCTARELCDLVNIGADPAFLITTEYRPRRRWREDIQKEEETI